MSHKNINLVDHKDLESICRLCLADSVSLLEIFPSDQVKDPTQCTIPQKIYYCTSLEVSEIDGLPTHICTECCRQVNIAHTFKLRCLVTDAKLRQHLHSLRKFSVQVETIADTADSVSEDELAPLDYEVKEDELAVRDTSEVTLVSPQSSLLAKFPRAVDANVKVETAEANLSSEVTSDGGEAVGEVVPLQSSHQDIPINDELTTTYRSVDIDVKVEISESDSAPEINSDKKTSKLPCTDPCLSVKHCKCIVRCVPTPLCKAFTHRGSKSSQWHSSKEHVPKEEISVHKTPPRAAKFVCTYCWREFRFKYSLKRHEILHKSKVLRCRYCEKTFLSVDGRYRHEKIHKGDLSYHCHQCDKTYVSNTSFTAHIRKHTGERPFKCSECSESFYLTSSFSRHMAKHSGVKTFICEICDASFWVSDDLRAHVNRIH